MCRREPVVTTLQFMALWLVVVARSFVFGDFSNNETDVLPVALQFANQDWLAGDWYLNLATAYRGPFNAIAGPLVAAFGFKGAAITGRLVVHTLFAAAAFLFLRTFRIRFAVGLLFLFLFLNNQSLIALERMTGGFEAKTMAWPFVLLTCVAVVHRRWPAAFIASGIALSLHVLVGLYALACWAGAVMLSGRTYLPARSDLRHVWMFCLAGAWGLYAVFRHTVGGEGGGDGWLVYVTFRVPHHVLPHVWSGSLWVAKLSIAAVLVTAVYRRAKDPRIRFLAGAALCSVGLFMIGLLLAALGEIELLRFYWFRFPDSFLPFTTLMLLAVGASRGFDSLSRRSGRVRLRGFEYALIAVLAVLSASEIIAGLPGLRPAARWATSAQAPMYDWIAGNTPRDATFLIDPSAETFYVRAERAMFVSYKHSPQSEADIREWFDRLVTANGGEIPRGFGLEAARRIGVKLDELDAERLEAIAHQHGVDYYLGAERPLPFRLVHRLGGLALYELKGPLPAEQATSGGARSDLP